MSKYDVYSTEDLIVLESKNQAVAIIGFSLSKQNNKPLTNISNRITNYLNSFGHSYVIRITRSYSRFFLLIAAKNSGEAIKKVSKILDRIEKLTPTEQDLVVSPLDHSIIMRNLPLKEHSSIKKTNNPRILNVDNEFYLVYSLTLIKHDANYFSKFLKSLLGLKTSTLNFSTKFSKKPRKKNQQKSNSILITHQFTTLDDCENFLNRIKQISAQFDGRFACTLHFHSANEVKKNIYSFIFGLSPVNQIGFSWSEAVKLDRFIPLLKNYDKSIKQEKQKGLHKQMIAVESGSGSTIIVEEPSSGIESNGNPSNKSIPKRQETLIPYGKKVSEEEIEELVNTIPAPPF